MLPSATRRGFLRTAAIGGGMWGLGDLSFLTRIGHVSAAEAKLDPAVVRLDSQIEPLVLLLEETPRERLLEEVAARICRGLSYRDVLAALLLAGVRNVQPRPNVGFKFHAVLVVNSAHLASISGPDEDRWLPIFWALDHFKSSQAADVREGNWTMGPVDESAVPAPRAAREAFVSAMDNWDEAAADVSVAGLSRVAGSDELFELFCRYGARDFRDIGHKAIFVANSWRTLQCIGWQHAEPVLRSLAYALVHYNGDNPAKSDQPADRPWRENQSLAQSIRADWQTGKEDDAARSEMLVALRQSSPEDNCKLAVELLNRGNSPQVIWDALFAGAAELLMRSPGIVALHAVTSTNALRYAYAHSGNDETRRLLLLQNAAFVPLFREELLRRNRNGIADGAIDQLASLPLESSGPAAVEEVFADVSSDRARAAAKALSYLQSGAPAADLIQAARRLVFLKGNDAHDYKYSSAVLEDYDHISPAWRDRCLAASMFQLCGARDKDNSLVARTRAAFGA